MGSYGNTSRVGAGFKPARLGLREGMKLSPISDGTLTKENETIDLASRNRGVTKVYWILLDFN
jgi:hypothetical protein